MRTRIINNTLITPTADSWQTETDGLGTVTEILRWHNTGQTIPNAVMHSIWDERPQMKRYGTVLHSVSELTAFACAGQNYRYTQGGKVNTYHFSEYALFNRAIVCPGTAAGLSYSPGILLDNWQSMSVEAVKAMTPSFNERNSLVNFVLELKDLKRIPDLWKDKSGGHNLAYSWKGVGRRAAETYLNWEFGIAPLVSDVTSLVNGLRSFKKKLADLEAGIGKTQTRHYKSRLPFQTLPPSLVTYQEGGGNYQTIVSHSWVQVPVYHASMRFKYNLPDMSQITNQIAALLDVLGVRLNGAVAWNAVRYTFIIDWFVNVSKFLNALSVDNLQIPIVIEDFCHSVKYSVLNSLHDSDYGTRHLVAQRTVSSYDRRRESPHSDIPGLSSGGFGWREVALSAAMLTVNSSSKGTKGFRHG